MAANPKVKVKQKPGRRVPAKLSQLISEKETRLILNRAKIIAQEMATKELATGPTGTGFFRTPYRPRTTDKRYKDSFAVRKSNGVYILTNDAKTRVTKGRQKPQRFLAPIIERGAKAHIIKPVNGSFLRWQNVKGQWVWIGEVTKTDRDGQEYEQRGPKAKAAGGKPGHVNHPGQRRGKRIMQRAVEQAMREYKSGRLK